MENEIIHKPGRCAGHPTVGNTRITVHGIISRLNLYGWDREALRAADDVLADDGQIDAAVAYYRAHPEEIDGIIADQRRGYEEGLARQKANEARKANNDFEEER